MKYESSRFIKTGGMEWEPVNDKLKRKIMGLNDEIMMVLVHFQKGGIGERHAHFHSQTTYVESGTFEVYIYRRILNMEQFAWKKANLLMCSAQLVKIFWKAKQVIQNNLIISNTEQ